MKLITFLVINLYIGVSFGQSASPINYYGEKLNVDGKEFVAGGHVQVNQEIELSLDVAVGDINDPNQKLETIYFVNEEQMKSYKTGKNILGAQKNTFKKLIKDSDLNEMGSIPIHYVVEQGLDGKMGNQLFGVYYLPLESVGDYSKRMLESTPPFNTGREDAEVGRELHEQLNRSSRSDKTQSSNNGSRGPTSAPAKPLK